MSDEKSGCSFDLGGILLVVFLTLKLSGVIDWSWWWILAPLWIPVGLACIALAVAFAISITLDFLGRQ